MQVELDAARGRTIPDHDVNLVVLHGRVEDFLDYRRESVDLVDEEHIVGAQVGEHRGEVLGLLQDGAAGLSDVDTHLLGDDVREGSLAQARRAEQKHMVQSLASASGCLHENFQLATSPRLADVFIQGPRAQCAFDGFFPA